MEKCRFCDNQAKYAGLLFVAEEGDDTGYVCADHTNLVSRPVNIISWKARRGRDRWNRFVETGRLA